jgi:hypothetical protein
MMRRFLFFCLPLMVCTAAAAADAIKAEVLKVEGRAQFRASNDADWQPLKTKIVLRQNASVRTDEGAKVVLAFGDGKAVATIHELSFVHITALAAKDSDSRIRLGLKRGSLWNKVKKGSTRYTIYTPAAIASVRGTEFFVEADGKTRNSRIGVWDGSVEVGAARSQEKPVAVNAGQVIEIVYNKPPKPPYKMQQKRIEERKQLQEMLNGLGLAGLGGSAGGMAKVVQHEQEKVAEFRQELHTQRSRDRGEKGVRSDFKVIERALAKLYRDTEYLPTNKRRGKGKASLQALLENKDEDGAPIDGWNGPYLGEGTNLRDPFGADYTIYVVPKRKGIFKLQSRGLDKVNSADDVETIVTARKLQRLAEENDKQ